MNYELSEAWEQTEKKKKMKKGFIVLWLKWCLWRHHCESLMRLALQRASLTVWPPSTPKPRLLLTGKMLLFYWQSAQFWSSSDQPTVWGRYLSPFLAASVSSKKVYIVIRIVWLQHNSHPNKRKKTQSLFALYCKTVLHFRSGFYWMGWIRFYVNYPFIVRSVVVLCAMWLIYGGPLQASTAWWGVPPGRELCPVQFSCLSEGLGGTCQCQFVFVSISNQSLFDLLIIWSC